MLVERLVNITLRYIKLVSSLVLTKIQSQETAQRLCTSTVARQSRYRQATVHRHVGDKATFYQDYLATVEIQSLRTVSQLCISVCTRLYTPSSVGKSLHTE